METKQESVASKLLELIKEFKQIEHCEGMTEWDKVVHKFKAFICDHDATRTMNGTEYTQLWIIFNSCRCATNAMTILALEMFVELLEVE